MIVKNTLFFFGAGLIALTLFGCSEPHVLNEKETLNGADKATPVKLRVATFNAYLNRPTLGQILLDMKSGTDTQIAKVAQIVQLIRPDLILLNEIDYVDDGSAIRAFQQNYLGKSQGEQRPIHYPYMYLAESNTGVMSEFDLNNDGEVAKNGNDAWGYGAFYGQYAMVVLSQYPIDLANVRTFQKFLWKDMPDAMLPIDPSSGEGWYSPDELKAFRLSSKSHWDLPVQVNGKTLHLLASHPTPPTFDGEENRNGMRNHDEIRLWRDYVDPKLSEYIYDDEGQTGGLGLNKRFIIAGDLNASDVEGDATNNPIGMLKDSSYINADVAPASKGGVENAPDSIYSANHTAHWKMRADYVIPSTFGIQVEDTAVFWPDSSDPHYGLVGPGVQSSDHRLVWADIELIGTAADDVK